MLRSKSRAAGIAALALAVWFAASAANVSEFAFTPPPGWQRLTPPRGMLGLWILPGAADFRQNISLARERFRGTLGGYATDTIQRLKNSLIDFRLGANQPTIACTAHPGRYITYAATVNGRLLVVQQVVSVWLGYAYTATYSRLAIQPSLPAARDSLTKLCVNRPKQTTGTVKPVRPVGPPALSPAPAKTTAPAVPAATVTPVLSAPIGAPPGLATSVPVATAYPTVSP